MSLIEVKGLTKSYGDVHAVRGLDLTIEQGEIFSILGPNGAGKTTTVEILEGFRNRDSGSISVLGFDPSTKGQQSREWRNRIGIVLQTSADAGDLTVFETINHFSGYYSNPRDVEEVIHSVGLQDKRDALIRNLSGGQRRRLDVALGIIGNPELLFLDEPTTGFDPEARRAFWSLIKKLRSDGATILLTTHYLDEAEALADRVAVINKGVIVEISTPAELGGRATSQATVQWRDGDQIKSEKTDNFRRGGLEIRQFARQRESVVFTLLFPVILLAIFGSVFQDTIAPGVTFSQYFVAGMIASGLVNTGFQALAITIPMERDVGALKRLRGTPMPASSYFIGKTILIFVSMVIQILLLLGFGIAFFGLNMPTDSSKWLTFTWLVLLGSACSTALGIAFSIVPKSGRGASAVVSPIVIILQFFSGVFFVFTQLPGWMQQVAAIFPLKWLTQGMRSVFLPDSFASQEVAKSWELQTTFLVLAVWLIIGIFFSVRKFKWDRD